MSERLLVAINEHATGAKKVRPEVLQPLIDAGIAHDTFTTPSPHFDDNVEAFAGAIREGDRVIVPAGDGTVSQAANAIIGSGYKNVELAALPYGGFVDLAAKRARVMDVIGDDVDIRRRYPLAIRLNGESEPWRYADGYLGMGRLALIAGSFSTPESKSQLSGRSGLSKRGRQVLQLGRQYFRHNDYFLPDYHTSTSPAVRQAVTDVMLINNGQAGGIMHFPKNFGEGGTFGVIERDISNIPANIPFGLKALVGHAPSDEQQQFSMRFDEVATVPVHNEGEFAWLDIDQLAAHKDANISYLSARPLKRNDS